MRNKQLKTAALTDGYGRQINYLRISLTDRCNLRCIYCMGPTGVPPKPRHLILNFEEIKRVVSVAVGLGITKIRITGGEPLVRKGIVNFVSSLNSVEGIQDLSLTTNGILLKDYAFDLAQAGLSRVNISLDTLKPERYRYITRRGEIRDVWAGIEKAMQAGLKPVKVNVVVMKGINDDEITDLVRLSQSLGVWVRFIEFMPVHGSGQGYKHMFMPAQEIIDIIEQAGFVLKPEEISLSSGPAKYYHLPEAEGKIGFITPLSRPFCIRCNRLRLSSDGLLKSCLFSTSDIDLKPYLRNHACDEEIIEQCFLSCLASKPRNYSDILTQTRAAFSMSGIGG